MIDNFKGEQCILPRPTLQTDLCITALDIATRRPELKGPISLILNAPKLDDNEAKAWIVEIEKSVQPGDDFGLRTAYHIAEGIVSTRT